MNKVDIINLNIRKIEIKIPENFTSKQNVEKIKKLLPSIEQEEISFYLKNANCAVANGLRRIIIGEIKTKILTCEISNIITNEDFVILHELIDMINYIPIKQDIPLDVEFSLNFINNDKNSNFTVVHSSDIKQISGKTIKDPFAETFRLAQLRPGKFLTIDKIKIVENYGYNYSAHCLTTQFTYDIIDFPSITFINDRGNFCNKRVYIEDLKSILKKNKIKIPEKSDYDELIYSKTILVIPDKSYYKQIAESEKYRIKKFDIILELNIEDKLKQYESTEIDAHSFRLSFRTHGNIKAVDVILLACENIIERLQNIKKAIINKDSDITIITDNIKTSITIRGEDFTISQLIKRAVFALDPSIGLINDSLYHTLNRIITINIIHQEPIKIIIDAIDVCINQYDDIKKQIGMINQK